MKNWGLRSKLIGLLAPFLLLFSINVFAVNTFPSTLSCPANTFTRQPNTSLSAWNSSCNAVSSPASSQVLCHFYRTCSGTQRISTSFTSQTQSCPANSSLSGSTCTPNSGYNAFLINGVWTVQQVGQSCGTLTNPNFDKSCTCNTEALPYKYSVTTGGYRCSAGSDAETTLTGVLAAALGFNTALATGLAASITACLASIVCAGALALAGIGAAVAGIGFALDADPSSTINPNAPLQVTLAPAGSPTPDEQNNKVRIGGFGEIVKPLNATQDPQQSSVWKLTTGSQTVAVDTSTNTATFTDTTTPNDVITITTNGSSAPMLTRTQSSNWGTSSTGKPVTQIKTTRSSLPRDTSLAQQQATTQTNYSDGEQITDEPPTMGSCVGQGCVVGGGSTGGGTGTGGTSSGTGGGDCDKEPQKCFMLSNIASNTSGAGSETVLTQISQYQDVKLNEYQSTLQGLADDFLNSELFTSEITQAFNDMPSIGKFLQEQSENGQTCSISFNSPYGNIELNLCPYQSQIQAAVAFGIFILLMISLRNMFLSRKSE